MTNKIKTLKLKLYNYFAVKNWGVNREYGPYVRTHMEEHYQHRWKHWWLLIRLNWHYRVLRKTTYLLPDENRIKPLVYPESKAVHRENPDLMIERLSKYDVVSFDMFDTLVFRPFSKPEDMFYLLEAENKLLDFAANRLTAQNLTRDKTKMPNMEIDIYDIYHELENFYSIDVEQMVQQEIAMEVRLCYANPYMQEVVSGLLAKGVRIIIISDMYIPSKFLREILDNCGYGAIKEVYVSCEYGAYKRDGKLLKAVRQELGEKLSVVHVDDTWSCIEGCKTAKWNYIYYKKCNEVGEPYRLYGIKTPLAQMYQGIVNNHIHCGVYHHTPLQEFGYIYGGILACGYCEWINDYCKNNSCDKILFLARDMDLFCKTYQKFYNEIPNEYVSVSRNALQELVFEKYPYEYISHVVNVREGLDKTIGQVLDEGDLSFLKPFVRGYGTKLNVVLDHSNRKIVTQLILDHRDEIIEYFGRNMNAVKQYFQEAIGNGKKICIAGLGWVGSEIMYLKYLIQEKWGMDVELAGVTLGSMTSERAISVVGRHEITPYIFGAELNRNLILERGDCIEEIIRVSLESLLSSEAASLVKYEQDEDGKIKFVTCKSNPNRELIAQFQEGALEFVQEFLHHRAPFAKYLSICGIDAYEPLFFTLRNYSFIAQTIGKMKEAPRVISGYVTDYVRLFDMIKDYKILSPEDETRFKQQLEQEKFLEEVLSQVNPDGKYDDIYVYKHHIGEIYLYLNMVKQYIAHNQSKTPVLLVNEKRYISLYKMFISDIDMVYVPLSSDTLDRYFTEEMITVQSHRFFSPTPDRFGELRYLIFNDPNGMHFYDYIRTSLRIPATQKITFSDPMITEQAKEKVNTLMASDGLKNAKFIVIFPEAVTASRMTMSFWETVCKLFQENGYRVVLNAVSNEYDHLNAVKYNLPFDEIYYLVEQSEGIVALVNGLVVQYARINVPRYIMYTRQTPTVGDRMTATKMLDAYRMDALPNAITDNLYELDMSEMTEDQLLERIASDYSLKI